MTRILSKNFDCLLEDCGKRAYGGNSPVTYGDYFEFEGFKEPAEVALTFEEDRMSA